MAFHYMNKYRKGEKITSIDELLEQNYAYINGRLYHSGWFWSWQFRLVAMAVKCGDVYKAERIDENEN